jgi:uncharacterized protein YndB with AHSA1/START domain
MKPSMSTAAETFVVPVEPPAVWQVLTDLGELSTQMYGLTYKTVWNAGEKLRITWRGCEVAVGEVVATEPDSWLQYRLDENGDACWVTWTIEPIDDTTTQVTLTLDALTGEPPEYGPCLAARVEARLRGHTDSKAAG